MLQFDDRSHRFVGECYLVSAEAFFTRVRDRCRAGAPIAEALNGLCDEREWALDTDGVAPLFTAADLLAEAAAILAAPQRSNREGGTTAAG